MDAQGLTRTESFDNDELLALARLDVERGDMEGALAKIKKVLADEEPPAEAQAMAARLYAQIGLPERAQTLFEAYLRQNPTAVLEAFQLGMTHFDSGRPGEALDIWESLLHDNPVHPPALFYKGLVLAQEGRTADARQTLDTLLQSASPDNLYFGKAKELLQTLITGQVSTTTAPPGGGKGRGQHGSSTFPKEAYKTEH